MPERQVFALIDTGASASCITEELAKELDLPIIDRRPVGGVGGKRVHNVYLAHMVSQDVGLQLKGEFIGVADIGAQPLLIGRDFLARAVLIYDGPAGVITICA